IRLCGRKHFVERGRRVGIEIVHHYDHLRGIGILFFENLLHEECPILLGPIFRHFQKPLTSERFIGNEQVRAAFFLVGVVFPRDLSRLGRFGGIFVFDQVLAHLIHANARERGIIGLAINIEYIFHVVDKVRVGLLGKTPPTGYATRCEQASRKRRVCSVDLLSAERERGRKKEKEQRRSIVSGNKWDPWERGV